MTRCAVSLVAIVVLLWRPANALGPPEGGHYIALGPAAGIDLEPAAKAAAGLPRLRSLLVSHRGELVLERYFGGARAAQPVNIKSASKSVISALVGMAVSRGLIKNVRQPIADYFPELTKDRDALKRAITIEDLLTMRSGLPSTSGRDYGAWVQSPNWVRYVLSRPLAEPPGTRVEYSTGSSHLLSAILTKATKTSTWQFAQEALARPLGFSLARWTQDPQGVFFGGNEMLMTSRQMVRFGELYLNDGRIGDRQLLPKSWIAETRVPRGRSRWGSDREYGYGFWIRELAGHEAYYAWGYGGQFVFIIPDMQLVVVTTSRSDVSRERRDHLGAIYDLVERSVIPAIAAAGSRPSLP
ncbi:MAG: serine hydrolase [Vicinamibacterales bacterium]|jgi:CubicO group peptidase (beta-lactamase class C family)